MVASEWTIQELAATRKLILKLWGQEALNEFNRNYVRALISERGKTGDVFIFADHADGSGNIIIQRKED